MTVSILANISSNEGHWLNLQLFGIDSHRDAVGARVTLQTDAGRQIRQVKGGSSYLSAADHRLFFGLGEATTIEKLEVEWPSGQKQVFEQIPADQFLVIREGTEPLPLEKS